jgi:rhodanese-related sulfurtransferase
VTSPAIKAITCQALYELIRSEPVELIDVRTPEEFRDRRVASARSVPLDSRELLDIMHAPGSATEQPRYFICEMGGRSAWACAAFMAAGHPNVINVDGGTAAWAEAGLPTASDQT